MVILRVNIFPKINEWGETLGELKIEWLVLDKEKSYKDWKGNRVLANSLTAPWTCQVYQLRLDARC